MPTLDLDMIAELISPTIASFLRSWREGMTEEDYNRLLKPLIPRLVGTKGDIALELRRSWMAIDWLVRECAPAWLHFAGLTENASALRSAGEIKNSESANRAFQLLLAARQKALDFSIAIKKAGYLVPEPRWDAARASAVYAARNAAQASVGYLAWIAAWYVAVFTAVAASGKNLRPTVELLQASALNLVKRMIEAK
jgi:hypothetical protein